MTGALRGTSSGVGTPEDWDLTGPRTEGLSGVFCVFVPLRGKGARELEAFHVVFSIKGGFL